MEFAPELKIQGRIPISEGVSFGWDCGLSPMVRSLLASVFFRFELSRTLYASVEYAHVRSIVGAPHGPTGPTAAAALIFQLF